jgi:hypothetical protein
MTAQKLVDCWQPSASSNGCCEPEETGILTLFFFPVWCLLVVLGLLIGRRAGLRLTGVKRVAQSYV